MIIGRVSDMLKQDVIHRSFKGKTKWLNNS